jgi:hypothetical protein
MTPSDPERWTSRRAGPLPEDAFGQALRVVAATTLTAPAFAARAPKRRPRRLPVLVGLITVLGGGAVWAMLRPWTAPSTQPQSVAPRPLPTSQRPTNPTSPPKPAPPAAPISPAAPARPAARPAQPSEATLLWTAFRLLRQQHDPAAALRKLDEHRRHFPASALRTEADLARAEALVALGRRAEATALLDQLPRSVTAGVRARLGLDQP